MPTSQQVRPGANSRQQFSRWCSSLGLPLLLLAIVLFTGLGPVRADAGRFLASPDYAELSAELASLRGDSAPAKTTLSAAQQQRLADLQDLERQIARSDDRAQLRNRSGHNLGLFARHKKDPADQPPGFYVLAPGHSTDDDVELVALLIPSGVALSWGEAGESAAISPGPRVVRVLAGQQLAVRDPQAAAEAGAAQQPAAATPAPPAGSKPAAPAPTTYQLSQPPFQVLARWQPQPSLPELSQLALDQEPETAPLD